MAEKFAIQKLNGRNWQTWSIRIEALLLREDLWSAVSDEIPAAADRKPEWVEKDRKARATMLLLLEDNQLSLVKGCAHAKTMYDKLKSYHMKTTRSFRVSLLKRLCSTNLTERGDLEQHVLELDELFDRLQAAGMDLAKEIWVCMLLRSLPTSFDHLVAALDLQSDDDLTLDTVKSKLSDEYQRRLERDDGGEVEKAMRSAEQREKVCYKCRKPGHFMRHCRSSKKSDVTAMEEEWDEAKAAHSETRNVAFTAGDETAGWMLDSGASAHMTNDRSMFTSLRKFAGGWITLADGKREQILGEGSVMVYGLNGEGDVVKIHMKEVKFVPGLSTNLISVSKLARIGLKVFFDDVGCRISDRSDYVVATGERRGGMYLLCEAEAATMVSAGLHTDDVTVSSNTEIIMLSNGSFNVERFAVDPPATEEKIKLWPIPEEPTKDNPSVGWPKQSTRVEPQTRPNKREAAMVGGAFKQLVRGKEELPYRRIKEPSKSNKSTKYRGLVGGLMYSVRTATRDIAVSQWIFGRKLCASNEAGSTAAKPGLRYQTTSWTYSDGPDEATAATSAADRAGNSAKLNGPLKLGQFCGMLGLLK